MTIFAYGHILVIWPYCHMAICLLWWVIWVSLERALKCSNLAKELNWLKLAVRNDSKKCSRAYFPMYFSEIPLYLQTCAYNAQIWIFIPFFLYWLRIAHTQLGFHRHWCHPMSVIFGTLYWSCFLYTFIFIFSKGFLMVFFIQFFKTYMFEMSIYTIFPSIILLRSMDDYYQIWTQIKQVSFTYSIFSGLNKQFQKIHFFINHSLWL